MRMLDRIIKRGDPELTPGSKSPNVYNAKFIKSGIDDKHYK